MRERGRHHRAGAAASAMHAQYGRVTGIAMPRNNNTTTYIKKVPHMLLKKALPSVIPAHGRERFLGCYGPFLTLQEPKQDACSCPSCLMQPGTSRPKPRPRQCQHITASASKEAHLTSFMAGSTSWTMEKRSFTLGLFFILLLMIFQPK